MKKELLKVKDKAKKFIMEKKRGLLIFLFAAGLLANVNAVETWDRQTGIVNGDGVIYQMRRQLDANGNPTRDIGLTNEVTWLMSSSADETFEWAYGENGRILAPRGDHRIVRLYGEAARTSITVWQNGTLIEYRFNAKRGHSILDAEGNLTPLREDLRNTEDNKLGNIFFEDLVSDRTVTVRDINVNRNLGRPLDTYTHAPPTQSGGRGTIVDENAVTNYRNRVR